MSTRIYTLTMAAGVTQILPQGRFFMIKSAASALNIEARKRNGQPQIFENVGAGLQYNALESDKWYELHVTSGGVQTVEIVISDEAQVTFASVVSVAGTAAIVELPAAALATPAADVIANASALAVAASATRRRITLSALSTNTGSVFIQATGAGAGRGIELQPGTFVELK